VGKNTLIVLFLVVIVITAYLIIRAQLSRAGHAPGLANGKLAKCPAKPNCVCSEYKNDHAHYIQPIRSSSNHGDIDMEIVKNAILETGGQIKETGSDYLAATYSSKFFGFIDDLEIRIASAENLIHVRSASRAGTSDFSVNRKRVERLRKQLNERFLK